jgi:hypothetical protein
VLREVLHQAEEPGQIVRIDALFVERQDEVAGRGAEGVVRVFDALGDAAEGDHGADVVAGQEGGQGVVGDLGVDGHQKRPVNASSFRSGRI